MTERWVGMAIHPQLFTWEKSTRRDTPFDLLMHLARAYQTE